MADPGQMTMDNQWRTPQYRQKVVAQIDEAMRQSGNPITKTSTEMEQHVFQKAHNREEYLALVARVILHVRDMKNKNDGKFGPGGQQVQSGMPAQSPIDALNRLTSTGPGSNQQMQPGVPGRPMMTGPMQPNPHQMAQLHSQQVQHAVGSRMVPVAMQPGVQSEFIQQVPVGMQQQPQHPPFSVGLSQPQPMPGQMTAVMTGDNMVASPHCFQQTTPAGLSSSVVITPSPGSIAQQRNQLQAQLTPHSMNQPSNSMPGSEPSSVASLGMAHSPVTMLAVPSPSSVQPPHVAQSPASRSFTNASSPGTGLSGPSSVGPAPSPASQMSSNEEQAYLAKWKQLQIYIEPLKRMINRMAKDEDRKNMNKMKNLLDILSDSSKRVSMSALLKCEQVLRQMDPKPVTDSLPPKAADAHMCQTLLDAVVSQIKSPMLNHTLHRTFGPAIQALHGPQIHAPLPAPKRARFTEDSRDVSDIPNLLQGEVARLSERFCVTLHQLHHCGSRTIRLLCQLNDKHLPSVPPISVTIPEDYPQSSPICDPDLEEYRTTPFLEKVQKLLAAQLLQLPDKHALTALLNCWEMSIRKACSPASA